MNPSISLLLRPQGNGEEVKNELKRASGRGITQVPSYESPCEVFHRFGSIQHRPGCRAEPGHEMSFAWDGSVGVPELEIQVSVKETDKGPVVWEVRVTRFFPWEEGLPGPAQWLLIGRHVVTGEHKYFLSNAPQDTPLEQSLHVVFARWPY